MNLHFSPAGNITVSFASFFTGCFLFLSFTGQQSQSTKQKATTFITSQPIADTMFHMCDVMTGPEVTALSPFARPLKKTNAGTVMEGFTQCHYEFVSTDDYPQIMISLNEFGTADEAKTAYNMYVEGFRSMWERDPEWISNLCDSACFGGNANPAWCDVCGLVALSGRYYINVNFKGYAEQIPARQKQESAVNIVKLLIQKKPFLRKK